MATDYKLEGETWANPGDITWSFASMNVFGQPGLDEHGNPFFQPQLLTGIFKQDIINAFAAWSAVANVHFVQVADASDVDIRLGWENIDSPGKILAETVYDYDQGAHFTNATIGFDINDPWMPSGGDEKSQGAAFFIVALHEIGHALGLAHYNAQAAVMNAYIDTSLTGLTIHDIDGIVALYGPADRAPVVTAANTSLVHGTTVAVSTLFTVSDHENEMIQEYHFRDLSASASSGYFVLSGAIQTANTIIDVAAGNLGDLVFVAGTTGIDQLQVSASDGMHFSSVRTFTVTPTDHTPVVTAANVVATHGEIFNAMALFSYSDADNDPVTRYQFIDATTIPSSGHWDISGNNQAAGHAITVAAGDLGDLTFESGSGKDSLQVRANDGIGWGAWKTFNVAAPADHAPDVTAINLVATHGEIFTAAELIGASGASDADTDMIVSYQILDNTTTPSSGHWDIGGTNQVAGHVITVAAGDLGDLTFESGSGKDSLQVRAYDGIVWGAWDVFKVTAPIDHAPVVTATNLAAAHGQIFTAAELFGVSDADGNSMAAYQISDATTPSSSGHWDLGGVNEPAGKNIIVAAADLGSLTFESGSGKDVLSVRAYDGELWGAWKTFSVSAPVDHAPVVAAATGSVALNSHTLASDLFSVSDADGDTITKFQLQDNSLGAASGHWEVNGVPQAANHTITVAAADLMTVDFVGGSVATTDHLEVRAYDDMVWGGWHAFNVVTHA